MAGAGVHDLRAGRHFERVFVLYERADARDLRVSAADSAEHGESVAVLDRVVVAVPVHGVVAGVAERGRDQFAGGFDAEITEFLEWYIKERAESIWTKELYGEYVEWHNEMATGEGLMKEKSFSMKLGKTIRAMQDKGYKVEMKKAMNEKRMSLNKLFIGDDVGA